MSLLGKHTHTRLSAQRRDHLPTQPDTSPAPTQTRPQLQHHKPQRNKGLHGSRHGAPQSRPTPLHLGMGQDPTQPPHTRPRGQVHTIQKSNSQAQQFNAATLNKQRHYHTSTTNTHSPLIRTSRATEGEHHAFPFWEHIHTPYLHLNATCNPHLTKNTPRSCRRVPPSNVRHRKRTSTSNSTQVKHS